MRQDLESEFSYRSGRFQLPKTNTNQYKASVLPSAVPFLNENYDKFSSGDRRVCLISDFMKSDLTVIGFHY